MENQRKHKRIPIPQSDDKITRDDLIDRRKHFRIPIATVAHVTPHGLQNLTMVFMRDISRAGMGAYVSRQFQKGDILLVKIKLTTPKQGVIAESLKGKVRWVKEVEDEEEKYAFGLEFANMEQNHPRLYTYLEELESLSCDALFFLKKPF